ncbi:MULTISPECIES: amino acid ABC transporter ATP-binding protein [Labrys]|uniref:Amino acid ABC transporter ATP-binding protein n=1 Tax=Labrys neptuniae TaxID=376174 RepID=A0ABV3PQD6_9HYPH
MIQADNLTKSYGPHAVLKGVSLSMKASERVVLCGPSGSGKSTFIRCLNGLETRSGGDIRIAGHALARDCSNVLDLAGEVGMVFQQFNLFPHKTALENLMLAPRRVHRLGRREAAELAMAMLERMRLADKAASYPGQLSGGQQQRVAIARALCMSPKVMLFDEPTSALDPEMVKEVLDVMIDLSREGLTMVIVTHEMGFARNVADRVVFLDGGRIVESAGPQAFFENPQHARTRDFLRQIARH